MEGWHTCEIYRKEVRKASYYGMDRGTRKELKETQREVVSEGTNRGSL